VAKLEFGVVRGQLLPFLKEVGAVDKSRWGSLPVKEEGEGGRPTSE
jgi:hypothetical protein